MFPRTLINVIKNTKRKCEPFKSVKQPTYYLLELFLRETYKEQYNRLKDKDTGKVLRIDHHLLTCSQTYEDILQDVLPILIQCNDNVNFIDDQNSRTILHVYLASSHSNYVIDGEIDYLRRSTVFKIVLRLIRWEANLNAIDLDGKTPIHLAAEYRHKTELIQFILLLSSNYNAKACDDYGNNALHVLLRNYSTLDVNEVPLPQKIDDAFLWVIAKLLQLGCDPHALNHEGMAPIHYAVSYWRIDVMEMFETYDADFSLRTAEGDNLMFVALFYNEYTPNDVNIIGRFMDYLVINGCPLERNNDKGRSIMHCLGLKHRKIAIKLVNYGIEVNSQINGGITPLHMAVYNYNEYAPKNKTNWMSVSFVNYIKTLVFQGYADWDAIDDQGFTPLNYALLVDSTTITKHLLRWILKCGADINDVHTKKMFLGNCSLEKQNVILLRAVELRAMGFVIDKIYEKLIDSRIKHCEKYAKVCKKEVELMKGHMIQDKVSVYDFMHMKYSDQLGFVDKLSGNLHKRYPIYQGTIRYTCAQVKRRSGMVERAKKAWECITKKDWPDDIVERIFNLLNNWSLKNLIDNGAKIQYKKQAPHKFVF